MSGYPNAPSGYGAPPPPQPHGAIPYASPPPPQQYGATPYGAPPPQEGHQPYGQVASPYGASAAAYAAPPGNKPPKEHKYQSQGVPGGATQPPYGSSSGYPPSAPSYGSSSGYPPSSQSYGSPFASLVPSAFPSGTDPNVVSCFQLADQDGSGFIDDKELQRALSSYNQSFSLRTVHLLMYLFTNTNTRKIGPKEFSAVFYSLQNWRTIFEKFDRDRSGRIDSSELRDALLSLGYSVSPMILDLLVSKFDKSGGRNKAIEYDNFIECCLTVKGLTDKFKEKDNMYSGSATFTYESFMLTVLPFLVA